MFLFIATVFIFFWNLGFWFRLFVCSQVRGLGQSCVMLFSFFIKYRSFRNRIEDGSTRCTVSFFCSLNTGDLGVINAFASAKDVGSWSSQVKVSSYCVFPSFVKHWPFRCNKYVCSSEGWKLISGLNDEILPFSPFLFLSSTEFLDIINGLARMKDIGTWS